MGTSDDQRQMITFYGFYTYDWNESFGTIINTHYLLERDYISEGCSTLDSSEASVTHQFLYPHHIKKIFYIEGRLQGEICIAASGGTATVTDFRVTLCSMNDDTLDDTELASTGTWDVNDTLEWDSGLGIGEEVVYHYWIDIWEQQELNEHERLYLKIEVTCDQYALLMHSNDKSWTDVWCEIPFVM